MAETIGKKSRAQASHLNGMVLRRSTLPATPLLTLDYPQENEIVSAGDYGIRVSAPEHCQKVDICINQGDWLPCRKAAGYWWHDWSGYDDGEYEVLARAKVGDGTTAVAPLRLFWVKLAK